MRHLLIAGFPCAGKSHFSCWLGETQGYDPVNAEEEPNRLDALCWSDGTNVPGFMAALSKLDRPVAFDWGFPLSCLPIVRSLKAAGLDSWWFDADESQARAAFVKRARGAVRTFDAQVSDIRANRDELMRLFKPNVITTLDAAGRRTPPEWIWKEM